MTTICNQCGSDDLRRFHGPKYRIHETPLDQHVHRWIEHKRQISVDKWLSEKPDDRYDATDEELAQREEELWSLFPNGGECIVCKVRPKASGYMSLELYQLWKGEWIENETEYNNWHRFGNMIDTVKADPERFCLVCPKHLYIMESLGMYGPQKFWNIVGPLSRGHERKGAYVR